MVATIDHAGFHSRGLAARRYVKKRLFWLFGRKSQNYELETVRNPKVPWGVYGEYSWPSLM